MSNGWLLVIQISDLHLSPSHPFFLGNWRAAAEIVAARRPDVVIVTGDLTVNGADSEADLALAAEEVRALGALALPGNHDIGECRRDHDQPIDAARLDRYRRIVGPDWWFHDVGSWRLVALNAQLLGSSLPDEDEQRRWAEQACRDADGRSIAVFLHKPPFLASPDEDDAPDHAVPGAARAWLTSLVETSGARLVSCGHIHQYRARSLGAALNVCAPATSFIIDHENELFEGGASVLGFVEWRLGADGTAEHALVTSPLIRTFELEAIRQGYPSLRSMPPDAVEAAIDQHGLRG